MLYVLFFLTFFCPMLRGSEISEPLKPTLSILEIFLNTIKKDIPLRDWARDALFFELLDILSSGQDKSIINLQFKYQGKFTNFLIQAIKHGNHFAIEELLSWGAKPESVDGECPLIILALQNNLYSIIKLLLWYGADPEINSPDVSCALRERISKDILDLIELYKDKKLSPKNDTQRPRLFQLPFTVDQHNNIEPLIADYIKSFDISTILGEQHLSDYQVLIIKKIAQKSYITDEIKQEAYQHLQQQAQRHQNLTQVQQTRVKILLESLSPLKILLENFYKDLSILH